MNLRAIYTIYKEPVRLEKVSNGLWVTEEVHTDIETREEYFRSVDLFKRPMLKPRPARASESNDQGTS